MGLGRGPLDRRGAGLGQRGWLSPGSRVSLLFHFNISIALDTMQGNQPHLAGRGKSHGFSRVAAGTWGKFSSYSGEDMIATKMSAKVQGLPVDEI